MDKLNSVPLSNDMHVFILSICISTYTGIRTLPFTEDGKKHAAVLTTVGNKNQTIEPEFDTAFEKWLAKQSLPIEAALTTITGAFRGAVTGYVVEALFEGACRATSIQSPSSGGSIDPKVYLHLYFCLIVLHLGFHVYTMCMCPLAIGSLFIIKLVL